MNPWGIGMRTIILSILVYICFGPLNARAQAISLFEAGPEVSKQSLSEKVSDRVWRSEEARVYSRQAVKLLGIHEEHLLGSMDGGEAPAPEVELPLFDDLKITARFKRLESHALVGLRSWIGSLPDDPHGRVVLTTSGQDLAGEVFYKGQVYAIRPVGERYHIVGALALGLTEGEDDRLIVPASAASSEVRTQSDDDGRVIDVYVAYTALAAAASSNITVEIANDIAAVNAALDESCAQTSFRLVGSSEVVYTESGTMSTDIDRLQNEADGYMDDIHDLRDSTGADLVQLWTETTGGSYCGMGYMSIRATPLTENFGFSVKLRSCSSLTTAHELGHNLDVNHDRWQTKTAWGANTAQQSGYGFVAVEAGVRDIMSYGDHCTAYGVTCERLPYYANPRLILNGVAFGEPGFSDVVTRIRDRRSNVAGFRAAVTTAEVPSFAGCKEVVAKAGADKCFIATAAYGSSLASEVELLRRFRDERLSKSQIGRHFIEAYYRHSPRLADFIREREWLRGVVRASLYPVVWSVRFPDVTFTLLLPALLAMSLVFLLKGRIRARRRFERFSWLLIVFGGGFVSSEAARAFEASPSFIKLEKTENASVWGVSESGFRVHAGAQQTKETTKIGDVDYASIESQMGQLLQAGFIGSRFALMGYYRPDQKFTYRQIMGDGKNAKWETREQEQLVQLAVPFSWFSLGASYGRRNDTLYGPSTSGDSGASESFTYTYEESMALSATLNWNRRFFLAGEGAYLRLGGESLTTGEVLRSRLALGIKTGDRSGFRLNLFGSYNPESISGDETKPNLAFFPKTTTWGAQSEVKSVSPWVFSAMALQVRYEKSQESPLLGQGENTDSETVGARLNFGLFKDVLRIGVGADQVKSTKGVLKTEGTRYLASLSLEP